MKRTAKTRTTQRFVTVDLPDLKFVFDVVNGAVRWPESYEPESSEVRKIFDRIIDYCDRVESVRSEIGKKKSERVRLGRIAWKGLNAIFHENPRTLGGQKFTVQVMPSPFDSSKEVFTAEDYFRITRLLLLPVNDKGTLADIGVLFQWKFFQGIAQLDDLRRLRRCSGFHGDKGWYFQMKRLQRQEHYFCSDKCRSKFHYNKEDEVKSHGRKYSRQK